jgi:hypothetical protein
MFLRRRLEETLNVILAIWTVSFLCDLRETYRCKCRQSVPATTTDLRLVPWAIGFLIFEQTYPTNTNPLNQRIRLNLHVPTKPHISDS